MAYLRCVGVAVIGEDHHPIQPLLLDVVEGRVALEPLDHGAAVHAGEGEHGQSAGALPPVTSHQSEVRSQKSPATSHKSHDMSQQVWATGTMRRTPR